MYFSILALSLNNITKLEILDEITSSNIFIKTFEKFKNLKSFHFKKISQGYWENIDFELFKNLEELSCIFHSSLTKLTQLVKLSVKGYINKKEKK